MPHDGPNEPSWLELRPHLRKFLWWGAGLVTVSWMVWLFGPEPVLAMVRDAWALVLGTVGGGG